jgi:hypothetical protein
MQNTVANAANTNYVFVMLDDATNAVVLRINKTHDVFCNNANDIIAAFKQYNINKYDTIMFSSDVDFATEFNYAYDSAVHDMLDEALIACNII